MSNIFVVCGIDMIIDYKGYRIVAFSDTHGMRRYLETPTDADIWICAGDCIDTFSIQEFRDFLSWYASIPAKLRLFVAGNHELFFDLFPEASKEIIPDGIVLLENNGYDFEGIRFYSIPARAWLHQPTTIPKDVDFLITHGPAFGYLDEEQGCPLLSETILQARPAYHLFGHIHSQGGKTVRNQWTTFCNVSCFEELRKRMQG